MKNVAELGDRILFAHAKARLDEILRLVGEYNEIRDTLVALGYVISQQGEPEPWPLPFVDVSGNGTTAISDSDVLDEFLEHGPERRSKQPQPISRRSMAVERNRLGKESDWTCFYCHGTGDREHGPDQRVWHVDHAYPVIRGGDDEPDNHVLACATCNLNKKASTALEYFAKLTVRKTA